MRTLFPHSLCELPEDSRDPVLLAALYPLKAEENRGYNTHFGDLSSIPQEEMEERLAAVVAHELAAAWKYRPEAVAETLLSPARMTNLPVPLRTLAEAAMEEPSPAEAFAVALGRLDRDAILGIVREQAPEVAGNPGGSLHDATPYGIAVTKAVRLVLEGDAVAVTRAEGGHAGMGSVA